MLTYRVFKKIHMIKKKSFCENLSYVNKTNYNKFVFYQVFVAMIQILNFTPLHPYGIFLFGAYSNFFQTC